MTGILDDDSIPANARGWDFAMPPKSCWTLPLSSDDPFVSICITLAASVAALCEVLH
jgi:hypothetical protein